jgi:ABC-type multidrug transport system fused ATPase/permease subunit
MTAIGLQMTIEMTRQLDMAIRWSINCETSMVSVQRLLALANLPMESNPELDRAIRGGPTAEINHFRGKIEFTRVEMRYKPDLQPALQNLSFMIEPGQKIAVVGRTGAGKSTLYQLLLGFRTANKGCLLIDDSDVSLINLQQLRS